MRILLHSCCAPCTAAAAQSLRGLFNITAFFFNPNIHPEDERLRRQGELKRYARDEGIKIIESSRGVDSWFREIKGLEEEKEGGARCAACFKLRLDETARKAKERGFTLFSSTLSTGPGKNTSLINKARLEASKKYGVKFLAEDFKKNDGFKKAVEICRERGIYRQDYCGCVFSLLSKRRKVLKCAE